MKRFRNVAAVLILAVLLVFTSCSGDISTKGKQSSGYGRNYATYKKNVNNFDFPKDPNFARMTDAEFRQFLKDMAADPESKGCTAEIVDGSFYYSQGNIFMKQGADGEWWGAVPFNGEMLVAHYTNEWPKKAWATLLPGKPNLKFVGETVIEYSADMHQWMGMFINDSNVDINKVIDDYITLLERAGWQYRSNEYGEYYSKVIEGRITLVEFSSFGPFYYVYVLVDGV